MEFIRKVYSFLIDIAQTLLLVFAVFLVIYIFLFRPFQVSGSSMLPNFVDKQYVLTNLIVLKFKTLKLGDVVVFKAPPDPKKDYIKRIVGVPQDTVSIKNGDVYINGNLLDQGLFLDPLVKTYGGSFLHENEVVTVPENEYFVLGDNRSESSDSREWGFVNIKEVIGESFFIYWPIDQMKIIKNPYKDTK